MSSLESNGKSGNGGGSVGSVGIMVKLGASVVVDLAQVSERFDRKRAMNCHLRTLATSIPQVLAKMRTTTTFAENNVYGNINNSTKEVKSFFS